MKLTNSGQAVCHMFRTNGFQAVAGAQMSSLLGDRYGKSVMIFTVSKVHAHGHEHECIATSPERTLNKNSCLVAAFLPVRVLMRLLFALQDSEFSP
jgi:hypothetical protein